MPGPDIPTTSDLLDTAFEAARQAAPTVEGNDGALHAFVPRGFQLVKLADARELPPWPRSQVTVDDRASLSAYANRFKDDRSIIIADYDKGAISARSRQN